MLTMNRIARRALVSMFLLAVTGCGAWVVAYDLEPNGSFDFQVEPGAGDEFIQMTTRFADEHDYEYIIHDNTGGAPGYYVILIRGKNIRIHASCRPPTAFVGFYKSRIWGLRPSDAEFGALMAEFEASLSKIDGVELAGKSTESN